MLKHMLTHKPIQSIVPITLRESNMTSSKTTHLVRWIFRRTKPPVIVDFPLPRYPKLVLPSILVNSSISSILHISTPHISWLNMPYSISPLYSSDIPMISTKNPKNIQVFLKWSQLRRFPDFRSCCSRMVTARRKAWEECALTICDMGRDIVQCGAPKR